MLLNKDERVLRLRLRLTWNDQAKVVKLTVPLAFPVSRRVDGCPGGTLERACDGKEYPFHNFTALTDGANAGLALVSRDVFGIDVAVDGTVGLTLLRCPLFANDASLTVTPEDCFPVTDQGVHEYEIAILPFDGQDSFYEHVWPQRTDGWFLSRRESLNGLFGFDYALETWDNKDIVLVGWTAWCFWYAPQL